MKIQKNHLNQGLDFSYNVELDDNKKILKMEISLKFVMLQQVLC